MKTKISQGTSRRRFIQATAGSSIGVWAGGCLSSREHLVSEAKSVISEPASGSPAIAPDRGVATRLWIDPSIAAWQPGPVEEGSHRVPQLAARSQARRAIQR